MKRTWIPLVAVIALLVAACGGDGSETTAEGGSSTETQRSVALVLPGLIDDGSWNQAGQAGLEAAAEEGDIETTYTEEVSQDKQEEVIGNYAREGHDVIVAHGGEFMDAVLRSAEENPDVQFVVSNGTDAGENVTSLALGYGEMGYLAGVLAGSLSETGKIGMVVGERIPIAEQSIAGFEQGAERVGAEATISVTGDFVDVDRAREATLALAESGVDAFWPLLDAADAGVYAAAEDSETMVVGLYADQSELAPTAHIGAVLAEPAMLVEIAASDPDALNGEVNYLGVEAGVVDIGALSDRVTDDLREELEAAKADLEAGKITFD